MLYIYIFIKACINALENEILQVFQGPTKAYKCLPKYTLSRFALAAHLVALGLASNVRVAIFNRPVRLETVQLLLRNEEDSCPSH